MNDPHQHLSRHLTAAFAPAARWFETLRPYALLATLTWLAHFLRFRGFGLYEDDYYYIARYLDADADQVMDLTIRSLIDWPQGRPLQSIVPALLAKLAFPSGGLPLFYLIAFAITAASVVIFYSLAFRMTGSVLTATIGAVMFALYPADTTHPFLMHAFVLRLALALTLGACLRYLDRRYLQAYALAVVGLMLYETPFLVFLAAPLLKLHWDTAEGRKEFLRHVGICVALLGVTVLIRVAHQENRLVEAGSGIFGILADHPQRLVTGFLTSLRQMTYGPVKRIGGWDAFSLTAGVMALPLFYVWLRWAWRQPRRLEVSLHAGAMGDRRGAKLWLTGACLLLSAYLLSFTHQTSFIYGRLTSVHLSAAVGGSLLFAAVIASAFGKLARPGRVRLATGLLALHFALLFAYRQTIQADFVRSWAIQRWYWTNVVTAAPDATDGTVVLVDGADMPQPRYIASYSWFDPQVPGLLHRLPSAWGHDPIVLPLFADTSLRKHQGLDSAFFAPIARWYPLRRDNVILLTHHEGHLVRDERSEAVVQGMSLALRPAANTAPPERPRRPLHALLIDPALRNWEGRR